MMARGRLTHRKAKRRTPANTTKEEQIKKRIRSMGHKRSVKVQRRLNAKKRNGLSRQERKRKCKLDVCYLVIQQQHFDEIKSGEKIREWRSKTVKRNRQQIWDRRALLRYLWLWVRGSKDDCQMLVQFLGLDFEHEKSPTHFVCKLGDIISMDKTEIQRRAYKPTHLKM